MQRVRIFALKEDQARIISALQELGAVQLEQADRASFFKEATAPDYSRAVADEAFRFEGLAAALPAVRVSEKLLVGDLNDVLAKAKEIKIDNEVKSLKTELENIDVKLVRNRTHLEALGKVAAFNKDLSVLQTNAVSAGFYSLASEDFAEFGEALRQLSQDARVERYSAATKEAEKDTTTALIILPRNQLEASRPILEKFKAAKIDLPLDLGTPAEARKQLEEQNKELEAKKQQLETSLKEISKQYYGKVVAIKEALSIESQRFEVLSKMGSSEKTFVVEGWVPATQMPAVEAKLASITQGKVMVEKTKSKEPAPTLMQNKKSINYFEFLVRFFSLPTSEEIDPTITFAIVFPIFFGMMLGDVGYGFAILLMGIWFSRLASGKASSRWLPRPIRNFGRSLMPKRALGNLGKILIPSAIVGMIVGVIVNAYFGFVLPFYAPVLDLIRSPQVYLVITLFVGLIHITLGYIYGIFISLREGHKNHAYSKIGWLGFLWSGVAVITVALSVVLNQPLPLWIQYVGFAGLIGFGGLVAVFEKMRFIMEIPTLISHVVSYGRILGVLLASLLLGYIASVGVRGAVGGPASSLLTALIVFMLVTILNVVLGIFEPAIQGARLHYVEFYSKFFEGNGKRFAPFAERRNFTKRSGT